jgi:outer membrane protein assembly factor BamE (lipoprotein component of BamABCDE complex)
LGIAAAARKARAGARFSAGRFSGEFSAMNLRSRLASGALLSVLVLTAGCTRVRDHQGYLVDETLVAAIQPGVDNRDSVASTLGRPSFVGQFDQRDWYYVSRGTKNLAFSKPDPDTQMTLHIRFDEAGNVASVERTGLEKVASINPSRDKTPTLGRDRSFFEELFGNIGRVGTTGQAGGTADNPN